MPTRSAGTPTHALPGSTGSLAVVGVLLAAGKGTRLAPLTHQVPKILVPVGGRPLLEWQLRYLATQGISRVIVNVHHLVEPIEQYLERTELPLPVELSYEDELLGTAGALLPMRDSLSDTFVVLYGDVATDASMTDLIAAHRAQKASATLAVQRYAEPVAKGICAVDGDRRLVAFEEKPSAPHRDALVNVGIYVLEPEVLDAIGDGPSDFGIDVWPRCTQGGWDIRVHHLRGYLRDLGSPEALRAVEEDLMAGRLGW